MLPKIFDSQSRAKPGREYRVFELATESIEEPFLYPHGSPHTDEQAALADLKHKRETYGPYGRKFTLLVRGISPWREYEPFNPNAE